MESNLGIIFVIVMTSLCIFTICIDCYKKIMNKGGNKMLYSEQLRQCCNCTYFTENYPINYYKDSHSNCYGFCTYPNEFSYPDSLSQKVNRKDFCENFKFNDGSYSGV